MKNKSTFLLLGSILIFSGILRADTTDNSGAPQIKKVESPSDKAARKIKLAAKKRTEASEQDAKGNPQKATALRKEANKLESDAAQLEQQAKNPQH